MEKGDLNNKTTLKSSGFSKLTGGQSKLSTCQIMRRLDTYDQLDVFKRN